MASFCRIALSNMFRGTTTLFRVGNIIMFVYSSSVVIILTVVNIYGVILESLLTRTDQNL